MRWRVFRSVIKQIIEILPKLSSLSIGKPHADAMMRHFEVA